MVERPAPPYSVGQFGAFQPCSASASDQSCAAALASGLPCIISHCQSCSESSTRRRS